jgi:ATP-dependent phosphoenolpyruvate carboxykinase
MGQDQHGWDGRGMAHTERGWALQTKPAAEPPIYSADAVVGAMERRAAVLRSQLSEVEDKRAELAKLERMLAAAEEPVEEFIPAGVKP